MNPTTQRILAVIGLVLICLSIVLMLAGMFVGTAKAMVLNISLFCFLGAVTVLMIVNYNRKAVQNQDDKEE